MFAGVVVVGLIVAWVVGGDEQPALVGEMAPDFTVALLEGGTVRLSDELDPAGGPLILNLWASWCEPCRTEIPAISAFAATHPDVKVIGVAVNDTQSAARAFAAEIGASYPLAIADSGFEASYPHIGLPATYVIDPDGRVAVIFNGVLDEDDLEGFVSG